MIDLDNYAIFSHNLSTLKETSVDSSIEGKHQYMTLSQRKAVNFDAVKNEYISSLGLSETPKSNDALFYDGIDLVFVEFKNGRMSQEKIHAVGKKVYDSVLLYTDITSEKISDMRKNMKYILVYNEDVNQPSYDGFVKNIADLANTEHVFFGLRKFQNYCFREVHTYTKCEFEEYLTNL